MAKNVRHRVRPRNPGNPRSGVRLYGRDGVGRVEPRSRDWPQQKTRLLVREPRNHNWLMGFSLDPAHSTGQSRGLAGHRGGTLGAAALGNRFCPPIPDTFACDGGNGSDVACNGTVYFPTARGSAVHRSDLCC